MSISNVKRRLEAVLAELRKNGHDASIASLEQYGAELDNPALAEAALQNIAAQCHVRALGDCYIADLEWPEWLDRIDKLRKACEKELKPASTGIKPPRQ